MKQRLMLGHQLIEGGYVKSGLIVDLDGYNSPVNNEWLSSVNEYKFDASTIIYDSSNKKYVFNGVGSSYSKQGINYNGSNVVTIQIVDDGSLYNNTSLAIPFESSPDFNANTYCFLSTLSEATARAFTIANKGAQSSGYSGGRGGQTYSTKTLYTFVLGYGFYKLYINGSQVGLSNITGGGYVTGLTSYSSHTLYLGARNNSLYKTKMGLHSFRVYNRELSLSEIQTNLSIDRKRFNF